MKEIAPLLEKLATQLGTTVDYLWRVLIKQAFISSVVNLIQYAFIIAGCFVWWIILKNIHKKVEVDNWDEAIYIPLIVVGVILGIMLIVAFFSISSTISGFINPEYWALEKVLNTIK